jgi:membrane-anchored mycosin MYCP
MSSTPIEDPQIPDDRNNLVADLEHFKLVVSELDALGVRVTDCDRDPGLGLARLALDPASLTAAAGEIRARDGWTETIADRVRRLVAVPAVTDHLDVVLLELRAQCRGKYDGWVPEIGRYRLLGGVDPFGHIRGGLPPQALGPPEPGGSPPPDEQRTGTPGRAVRVGMLDSQILATPRLAGRFLAGSPADLLRVDGPYKFWEGHATSVAGRILDKDPDAVIEVRRVLRPDHGTGSAWDVAKKIVELAPEVDILIVALGGRTEDREAPLVLARAIQVVSPHTLVVAAAGNYEPGEDRDPMFPAALPNVVAVGAYDEDKAGAPTAPFSPERPWVDFEAPGVGITSDYVNGEVEVAGGSPMRFCGTALWGGTSAAAAYATGVIAAEVHARQQPARQVVEDVFLQLDPGKDHDGLRRR